MGRPRRAARALERFLLGLVMSFVAFVVEWRLLRAIRKGDVKEKKPTKPLSAVGDRDGLAVAPNEVGE